MKIITLQPPSPPHMNVKRDYAGGMGVADPSERDDFGGDSGYISLPYMSLLYCTAILERAGHEVRFIDAQTDGFNINQLAKKVSDFAPDIILSVINLPSVYGDLEVLRNLKDQNPGLRIIVTGAVAVPLFDEIAQAGAVDAIVRGDPEDLIADLVNVLSLSSDSSLFTTEHGVVVNREQGRITDLDALPKMPYHLVPLEKYWYHGFGHGVKYAAVFASRGCSFKCYYCPYPVGFGDCIVHRDPVEVINEIEELKNTYGIGGILFRDQVFSMEREKTLKLCDLMIERELNLKWVVETRLDKVDEELLIRMKKAGCVRVHYGLESGDPKLFSRLGKDGAEDRMERLIENFITTERVGIHPHMFILIGLSGETKQTIQSTIATIKRIRPLTLQVAVVTPYPGTPLYDELDEKGLILTKDWSQYTGFKAVARTETLSTDDLKDARELIVREHAKCIRGKRMRRKLGNLIRYTMDGSIVRRLKKR